MRKPFAFLFVFVLPMIACGNDELLLPLRDGEMGAEAPREPPVPNPPPSPVPEDPPTMTEVEGEPPTDDPVPPEESVTEDPEPPAEPIEPDESEDPFEFPCEIGQYADANGDCFWPDEVPTDSCDHLEAILHSGTYPYIASDEEGPMVVLNAADGAHLYGYRWDGVPRFDGQLLTDGLARTLQRTDDGQFTMVHAEAGEQNLLFVDATGQLTAISLIPNWFGNVTVADGSHLLGQVWKDNGGPLWDVLFANVNGVAIDIFGGVTTDYRHLDADDLFARTDVLAVRNNVWAYDDFSVIQDQESQTVRYGLSIIVSDREAHTLSGATVYSETAPTEYRWAQANAIVAQEGRFAVAWQKTAGDWYDSEAFLSFVQNDGLIHDDGTFPSIALPYLVQDMVAGEDGELLAVAHDDGVEPKQVRLLRINAMGAIVEDRVVAQADGAYALLRITHAAGRTAITWSTEPTRSGDPRTNGLVHLLILCD